MCDFTKDPNALPETDRRKNRTCIKCKRRKCDQPEDELCPLCWALTLHKIES
jgi:hypothetical protein